MHVSKAKFLQQYVLETSSPHRHTVCAFFEILCSPRMSIIGRQLSVDIWAINGKQIASLTKV